MTNILRIAEAVLYADDLQEVVDFYVKVLGLPLTASFGDACFFQTGAASTLIIFDRNALHSRKSAIPGHGSKGPGHVALAVPEQEMAQWRRRLQEHNVSIEHEQEWPQGTHSIYFRDPAGNSVELIEAHHYEIIWERLQESEEG